MLVVVIARPESVKNIVENSRIASRGSAVETEVLDNISKLGLRREKIQDLRLSKRDVLAYLLLRESRSITSCLLS